MGADFAAKIQKQGDLEKQHIAGLDERNHEFGPSKPLERYLQSYIAVDDTFKH